jgi:hypothetical protein
MDPPYSFRAARLRKLRDCDQRVHKDRPKHRVAGSRRIAQTPDQEPLSKRPRYTNDGNGRREDTSRKNPHIRSSNDVVEDWLEQLGSSCHHPRVDAPDYPINASACKKRARHNHRDRDSITLHERQRRVHAASQSEAYLLESDARSPTPQPREDEGKNELDLSSSSLLDYYRARRQSPGDFSLPVLPTQRNELERSGETPGGFGFDVEVSPPGRCSPESCNYRKRSRRKTRDDKYDKKRNPSLRQLEDEEALHRTKRSRNREKRRALMSTKKVMSNFNSEAILNDRITVSFASCLTKE